MASPPTLLPEPSAHLFLARRSLQHHPRPALGKPAWLRSLLPAPTASAGPDKRAGQAGPRVSPPAHQHLSAPAGKAATPGPASPWVAEPVPGGLLRCAFTSIKDLGPIQGDDRRLQPVRRWQSGPVGEGVAARDILIDSRGVAVRKVAFRPGPDISKQRTQCQLGAKRP